MNRGKITKSENAKNSCVLHAEASGNYNDFRTYVHAVKSTSIHQNYYECIEYLILLRQFQDALPFLKAVLYQEMIKEYAGDDKSNILKEGF